MKRQYSFAVTDDQKNTPLLDNTEVYTIIFDTLPQEIRTLIFDEVDDLSLIMFSNVCKMSKEIMTSKHYKNTKVPFVFLDDYFGDAAERGYTGLFKYWQEYYGIDFSKPLNFWKRKMLVEKPMDYTYHADCPQQGYLVNAICNGQLEFVQWFSGILCER